MKMIVSSFETKFTQMQREGKNPNPNTDRNMQNRKPYRTKAQKARAKSTAQKKSTGQYSSIAPRSFHHVGK
jgi:hypothetical protein